MEYEEAKDIVRNVFIGISQQAQKVCDALETISEEDYNKIQAECYCAK